MYRVVFEHRPKPGMEADFIAQWQKGSDIIQQQPGARGTKLFRSLDDPNILYAMAEWDSKQARDKAMIEIDKREDGEWVRKAHEQFVFVPKTLVSAELIAESDPN